MAVPSTRNGLSRGRALNYFRFRGIADRPDLPLRRLSREWTHSGHVAIGFAPQQFLVGHRVSFLRDRVLACFDLQ
jgi:hypothetical protein